MRKDEAGFTLVEVLVTILMMSMVVMALYSMFDMSLRVFSVGNSTVETNENARVALDRMEREIRSAWPSEDCADSTPPDEPEFEFISGSSSYITFRNCYSDTGSPTTISYQMNGNNLVRTEASSSPQSLAVLGTGGTPLAFRYLNASATEILSTDAERFPENVVLVEIKLEAKDGDQTQTLITNAGLRNAN